MYCIKCGNKLDDDALFCTECGYKQQREGNQEKKEKLKNKKRKMIIAGVSIFVVFIVVLAAGYLLKQERVYTSVNENWYKFFSDVVSGEERFCDQQGNAFVTASPMKFADGTLKYYPTQNIVYSGDGGQVAYSKDGIISILNEKGEMKTVADTDYNSYAYRGFSCESQKISFSGNAIAFQDQGKLCTWTNDTDYVAVHNQRPVKEYVISPNGRFILNTEGSDTESGGKELYYSVTGTGYTIAGMGGSTKISENAEIPLAVSDSGMDFYYIGKDYKLYYSDGKNEKCLSDFMIINTANAVPCYFNETCEEVVYCDGGIMRYYCAGDAESKIIGRDLNSCFPYIFEDMSNQKISTVELEKFDYNIVILGKKTFANCVFYDGSYYNYYWLDKNADKLKQIGNAEGDLQRLSVSEDYSEIIYMKNNQIYKVDTKNIGVEKCIYDVENVVSFSVSSDFKDLYIWTNTGKILYLNLRKNVSSKSAKIVAEISDIYYGAYNEAQKAYIVCTKNMELYKITPKKQILLSKQACLVDIPRIGAITYTVYDSNYEMADLYMLMKNGSSEVVLENYQGDY